MDSGLWSWCIFSNTSSILLAQKVLARGERACETTKESSGAFEHDIRGYIGEGTRVSAMEQNTVESIGGGLSITRRSYRNSQACCNRKRCRGKEMWIRISKGVGHSNESY